MKKFVALVIVTACSVFMFADNWPPSIVGTWQGVANQTTVKLVITSQGTTGACKSITGTFSNVPSGGASNIQGFYCPQTGRVSFVRKDVNSNDTFQSYSANVSDVGAELRMAGIFAQVQPDRLGEYGFAVSMQGAPSSTNLLTNPGFEILHFGSTPGKPILYPGCKGPGFSPAGDWTTWMNSCYWDSSSHTLTTELVPSTAPSGSHYMIHVITDGRDNGIVQSAIWSAPKTKSSAWVFVNKGCVGIGTGNGGNTNPNDATTCETGKWMHLQAPNGVSPANEFIIYSVAVDGVPDSLKGADFFADNAEVVSVP
jgi:hypothetical protein